MVEEQAEGGRGRSGDETGGSLGLSFSIMLVKPQVDPELPLLSAVQRVFLFYKSFI